MLAGNPRGGRVDQQAEGEASLSRPPAVAAAATSGRLLIGRDEAGKPGRGGAGPLSSVVVRGSEEGVMLGRSEEGFCQQPRKIDCVGHESHYIRTTAEPHVNPAPKARRIATSPRRRRPSRRASSRAMGTLAADVLPYL